MLVERLFEDAELENFLIESHKNNWTHTPFEKYPEISTKNKGVFGEKVVEKYMELSGYSVESPIDTGHDRIIGGIKTEIKFSLANSPMIAGKNDTLRGQKLINPDEFTFNHIAEGKDWDRLIFFGINPHPNQKDTNWKLYHTRTSSQIKPEQIRAYWMSKKDFVKHMRTFQTIFSHQQGGKKGNNDDYMAGGYRKFQDLINLPFVHDIKKW
tara:strand:+ start:32 stop:664 length:633 start_codon:yes stop_codon:yes gene_type:complete